MNIDRKNQNCMILLPDACSVVPFPDVVELRVQISYWISCHHSDPNRDLLTCPFRCGRNDFSSLEEVTQHLSEEWLNTRIWNRWSDKPIKMRWEVLLMRLSVVFNCRRHWFLMWGVPGNHKSDDKAVQPQQQGPVQVKVKNKPQRMISAVLLVPRIKVKPM